MLSTLGRLVKAVDTKVVMIALTLAAVTWWADDLRVFVYAASFVFHLINLQAFIFRHYAQKTFAAHSLMFRTLALGILITLFVPVVQDAALAWWALAPLAVGLVLQFAAIRALGAEGTYYGVELGVIEEPKRVRGFPYNLTSHPMHLGILLQLVGVYYLCPAFHEAWPFLVLGHVGFTLLTAVVEHFDLHVADTFYKVRLGQLDGAGERAAVDELREWSLEHFKDSLHRECSNHVYIKKLPQEIQETISKVRYSPEVLSEIEAAYPGCKVVPLPMTDELYLSRYNYDSGGDQGLFDKHYDGNLRDFPGMTVVRSLIYLSSDDHLEVVFDTSNVKKNMKTYDFGILDFHKEFHWVEGSYEAHHPPRVLLKCNYYVSRQEPWPLRKLKIFLNVLIFYVVKAAMEYSKSPKTTFQRIIGFFCNFFRRLNIVSPALPFVFIGVTVYGLAQGVSLVVR